MTAETIVPGTMLGIAEAAELTGLSPHTLRYYEQEGLVRPGRNSSGYRVYSGHDLRRLVFLTRMRLSGMTMQDLREYIALADQGPATELERREIMVKQRDRIRQQIRDLTLALETTDYKIRVYDGHPDDGMI
jgi:DNA-binding transcriptional MerR regulator